MSSTRLSRFVNTVRVKFRGGRGGDGCVSMLSLFANEFAGPDGGNGGNGGHIVLRATRNVKSLNNISSLYQGLPGERGYSKHLYGKNAEHKFINVPVGTVVLPGKPKRLADHEFEPDRSQVIAELDTEDAMFIAARGGSGGKGNAHYLSNKNRHPRIAEAGAHGEENTYELRMKIYAHVALIGLPNAGKSTLLKNLTRAQVKVGDYAFTTLHPQVGVIEFEDYTQVAISDLPGLIEDSHKNRGLGNQFMRSLQRCASLLYVIDMTNDPIGQFDTLVKELELFKKGLSSDRPSFVLANKMDQETATDNLNKFTSHLDARSPGIKMLTGSGKTGDGLEAVRIEIRRLHDAHQSQYADKIEDPFKW